MKTTRFYIDIELDGRDAQDTAELISHAVADALQMKADTRIAPEGVPRTHIVNGKVYAEQPWWTEIIIEGKSQEQIPLWNITTPSNGFRLYYGEKNGNQPDPD